MNEMRQAAEELLACKRYKDTGLGMSAADYARRKPLAWESLRATMEAEPLCMCKDRALWKCPGEWEPGCDLGANEKFVRVAAEQTPERLVRADGWYSTDGGLSYRHPAPNAAAPVVPSPTIRLQVGGSAVPPEQEASLTDVEKGWIVQAARFSFGRGFSNKLEAALAASPRPLTEPASEQLLSDAHAYIVRLRARIDELEALAPHPLVSPSEPPVAHVVCDADGSNKRVAFYSNRALWDTPVWTKLYAHPASLSPAPSITGESQSIDREWQALQIINAGYELAEGMKVAGDDAEARGRAADAFGYAVHAALKQPEVRP